MKKEKKPGVTMGFKNNPAKPVENKMIVRDLEQNKISPDDLANDSDDSVLHGGGDAAVQKSGEDGSV